MLIDIPPDVARVQMLILRLKNKDDVKVRREAARCCLKPPNFIKALPEKHKKLPEEYKELKKEFIKALNEAETNDEDYEVRRDACIAHKRIIFNIT